MEPVSRDFEEGLLRLRSPGSRGRLGQGLCQGTPFEAEVLEADRHRLQGRLLRRIPGNDPSPSKLKGSLLRRIPGNYSKKDGSRCGTHKRGEMTNTNRCIYTPQNRCISTPPTLE
jgi:hypothetical protein